jgi:hypothetical protein
MKLGIFSAFISAPTVMTAESVLTSAIRSSLLPAQGGGKLAALS